METFEFLSYHVQVAKRLNIHNFINVFIESQNILENTFVKCRESNQKGKREFLINSLKENKLVQKNEREGVFYGKINSYFYF